MAKIETAGRYKGRVLNSEFGETAKGVPFYTFELEDHNADTIRGWFFLTDAALPYTKEKLGKAFGFDGNFETLPEQVNGKVCTFVVVIREHEGKERAEVDGVYNINDDFAVRPLKGGSDFLRQLTEKAKRIPMPAQKAVRPAAAKSPF